jgi:Holliday junction DNA helicase RuvA
MIGWLSGTVRWFDLDAVCLEAGGVGYRVLMPLPDVARLSHVGAKGEAFVHTHVREDAIVLYGFADKAGLELFERLVSVSGLGPRTALSLMSGLDTDSLVRAIAEGDEARLTKVPGVGKKTAARLVLELRERFAKQGFAGGAGGVSGGPVDDLRSALANLGYKTPQIERALKAIKPQLDEQRPLSELVRAALQHIL